MNGKTLLSLALLVSLVCASYTFHNDTMNLETSAQTFIGAGIMLILLLGIASYIASTLIRALGRGGRWDTAADILKAIAIASVPFAILAAIIYIFTPVIVRALLGDINLSV